jgi:5-methyltetrahydrofolate--homocysteine methyltransferase
MTGLLERVRRGETVLGDGGLGSLLMERGLEPGRCPEAFVFERPEVLTEIGSLYLAAGAELLTTNTFGGSPIKLKHYSLDEQTEEINRRAVEILLDVAKGSACVAASVGPCGAILEPYGDTAESEVYESFERQLRALQAAGPDVILVETMTDLREATLAVTAAKRVAPGLPVVATMTFDPTPRGHFTIMGVNVEQAASGLAKAGADLVGSNCGNGIAEMVEIAREFGRCSRLPIAIQANAGLPENRGGQVVYPETPEFMAGRLPELVELGVAVIGGCCGTKPDHIRAMKSALARCRGSMTDECERP